jgi:hypothetical protein
MLIRHNKQDKMQETTEVKEQDRIDRGVPGSQNYTCRKDKGSARVFLDSECVLMYEVLDQTRALNPQ